MAWLGLPHAEVHSVSHEKSHALNQYPGKGTSFDRQGIGGCICSYSQRRLT